MSEITCYKVCKRIVNEKVYLYSPLTTRVLAYGRNFWTRALTDSPGIFVFKDVAEAYHFCYDYCLNPSSVFDFVIYEARGREKLSELKDGRTILVKYLKLKKELDVYSEEVYNKFCNRQKSEQIKTYLARHPCPTT